MFLLRIISWLPLRFGLWLSVTHFYKDNNDYFYESNILISKIISLAMDNSNYMSTHVEGQNLNPQIYAAIQQALLNSSQQAQVTKAQQLLNDYQSEQGYVVYIIEIINRNIGQIDNHLIKTLMDCTFTHLKVYVRRNARTFHHEDLRYLVNSLLQISYHIGCIDDTRTQATFMKMLKDVVEIISHQAVQIYPQIVEAIQANACSVQNMKFLPVCLNLALGLMNNISLLMESQFSNKCTDMVVKLSSILYKFTEWGQNQIHLFYDQIVSPENCQNPQYLHLYAQFKRKYQEILYLNIKFLNKALWIHQPKRILDIFLQWFVITARRIEFIDPDIPSLSYEQEGKLGLRGSDLFNYYHGKKWALKLLRGIMQKVLVYSDRRTPNARKVIAFYQTHISELTQLFNKAWQHQWPRKIRFELLRTMERLIECQPNYLRMHFMNDLIYYQENLLPPMIDLSNEKEILMESPAQFMYREEILHENGVSDYQSCRLIAARVWLKIANIDFYCQKQCKQPKVFLRSLSQLFQYFQVLNQETLHIRDIACFLLNKLKKKIIDTKFIQAEVRPILNNIIRQNLQISENSYFMVTVRAFQLAYNYEEILEIQTVAMVRYKALNIFRELDLQKEVNYDNLIMLTRASTALCQMMRIQARKGIHSLSAEEVNMVIVKLFELVRTTLHDELMTSANNFLTSCVKQLGQSYKLIAKSLQGWFMQFMDKDFNEFTNAPAKEYKCNYLQIAKGTIFIYETILINTREDDMEMIEVLDNEIIKIINCIFNLDGPDQELLQNGIELLCSYLRSRSRTRHVNPRMLMYCRYLILRVAGLSQSTTNRIVRDVTNQSVQAKRWLQMVLNSCEEMMTCQFQMFVPAVRLFIKHIEFGQPVRPFPEISKTIEQDTTNDTEYLVYLVNRFYGVSDPKKFQQTSNGKCFSLLALIHYYEHHQLQEACTRRVHSSMNRFVFDLMVQVHHEYAIKRSFAKYNSQLFCLWIHEVQQNFGQYVSKLTLEDLSNFLSTVLIVKDNDYFGLRQLHYYEQNNRCAFGLSTLIRLGLKFNQVWCLLEESIWVKFILYAIKFVFKSTETYIEDDSDEDEERYPDQNRIDQFQQNLRQYNQAFCQEEQINKNAPMKIAPYQEDGDWQDEDMNEGGVIGSDEEIYNMGGEEEEDEDCWQYEEVENCEEAEPLASHDDITYLLQTLFLLNLAKPQLYRTITSSQRMSNKMTAIIDGSNCQNDPQRMHFLTLSPEKNRSIF